MGISRKFNVIWCVAWPAAAIICFLRGRRRANRRRPGHRDANPPVPDGALDALQQQVEETVRQTTGATPPHKPSPPPDTVPADVLAAFAARYSVEREVRQLWQRVYQEEPPRRGMMLLVQPLVKAGALPHEMANAIEIVSRVASPAVHAQPISEAKVRFLQEVTPAIAAALRGMGETR